LFGSAIFSIEMSVGEEKPSVDGLSKTKKPVQEWDGLRKLCEWSRTSRL
jgi:hypothetical protein